MEGFFNYKGRLARLPFLGRSIVLFIILAFMSGVNKGLTPHLPILSPLLFIIVALSLIILSVFQTMKRLHDLGKSGWYSLLNFLPLVNLAFGMYLLLVKGTPGPNMYGEDPNDPSQWK